MFNEGISVSGDLVDLAVEDEIIKKAGAWFSYGEVRLGQGRETAKQFLRDNQDIFTEIRGKVVLNRMPPPAPKEEPPSPTEADS